MGSQDSGEEKNCCCMYEEFTRLKLHPLQACFSKTNIKKKSRVLVLFCIFLPDHLSSPPSVSNLRINLCLTNKTGSVYSLELIKGPDQIESIFLLSGHYAVKQIYTAHCYTPDSHHCNDKQPTEGTNVAMGANPTLTCTCRCVCVRL